MSRVDYWNERYSGGKLVWGREPNRFLVAELESEEPGGRALDLACGEGRNAVWLARLGWSVTAVDYSEAALERARLLAAEVGVDVRWMLRDVTAWHPAEESYDLVVILYLHIPSSQRWQVWEHAARALTPGGSLLVVGHARRNLSEGTGGPQDPDLLWEPGEVSTKMGGLGLHVDKSLHVDRRVETPEGSAIAIDTLMRARRPDE